MTVPPLSTESEISVDSVATRVKCELSAAARDQPWLKGWVGAITLTLEVVHKGGGAGGLGFEVPVHSGTFTVGFTGGPTESARRVATVDFPVKIRDLDAMPRGTCPKYGATNRSLEGELGLSEWTRRLEATLNPPAVDVPLAAKKPKGQDKAIGYTLEFELLLESSVTPGFKIVPASGHQRTGSLKLFANRNATHKLDIALTPDSPKAEKRLQDFQLRQQIRPLSRPL